ncbi:MAG: hypothetical protein ABSH11_03020 [Verrucomicrobiota bacterium]|jgi:hypothetical protein
MKTSRTFPGILINTFEFRARFAAFGFAIAALALMPFPSSGAQYYTNWAVYYFSNNLAQSGPLLDPDGDGELNVVEFAFGTNPTNAVGGITGCVQPLFGSVSGTNGVFQVEILEREGHQPGVQIDLYVSAQLTNLTNWFRPWWLRTTTNSLPSDPPGSVRELFTTRLPGTNVWFVRPKVQLFEGGAETANYYVATNGDNNNPGTFAQPYATLAKAASNAVTGNFVYVRGGVYPTSVKISFTKISVAGQPIRIRAYPGETPVLDFSGQTGTGSGVDGISISGNYYWLYGLVMTNAGHNSIMISGSNNIVERCVSLGARNTGFHITGGNGGTATPSSNLFLNCDSTRNYDPAGNGGDADGFSAKWSLGPGNVFSGCRSWENSDDGWDLWMGTKPVLITNCWAFRNGTNILGLFPFKGNGNGFKLGGNNIAASNHLVASLAFHNMGTNGCNGIDQNNNTLGQTVEQNTSWANLKANFSLKGANTTPHVVRNNVSFAGGTSDTFSSGTITNNNSWQVLSSTVNTNDFLSVDVAFAIAPRRDDGGLPETPFFRPVPGGRLLDKGVNIGVPFYGSAPDLGTFETPTW